MCTYQSFTTYLHRNKYPYEVSYTDDKTRIVITYFGGWRRFWLEDGTLDEGGNYENLT